MLGCRGRSGGGPSPEAGLVRHEMPERQGSQAVGRNLPWQPAHVVGWPGGVLAAEGVRDGARRHVTPRCAPSSSPSNPHRTLLCATWCSIARSSSYLGSNAKIGQPWASAGESSRRRSNSAESSVRDGERHVLRSLNVRHIPEVDLHARAQTRSRTHAILASSVAYHGQETL